MIGKVNFSSGKKIFASCDKELLEKRIKYQDFEIHLSKSFYGDKEITIEEIIENIKNSDSSNIFGKKICSLLIEKKIILKESIIHINDVPHIQIYKF
jgi:uncharacterized protein